MAKKFSKLVARVVALERALAKFVVGNEPARNTAKKAVKAKPAKKKAVAKKAAAKTAKRTVKSPRTAVKAKTAGKTKSRNAPASASRKTRHVPIPTIEQLAVSGAPQFVTPLDQV